ncbi:MAG: hypothetical protein AB8D78_11465 [Akkermansiaceae bacterium]
MTRFELEDIVAQSNDGIIYRALDTKSGKAIAIHRFFPFGQNNGGLVGDETAAFEAACERLSNAKHHSLRSVLGGGVDPIDQIPYLVIEWIDGIPLKTLLADEVLEPALVIDILRLTLETSIAISEIFEEEAIWVNTDIESIIVGSEEGGRGFTFCISPRKWLGTNPKDKDLKCIVELGEKLIGWKGRLVSDRSGFGLGGWFKVLKRNPETKLADALNSLQALVENAPIQSEDRSFANTITPLKKKKKGPSKRTLAAVAIFAASIPASLLFYLHKTAEVPKIDLGYVEQEISTANDLKKADPQNSLETVNTPTKKPSHAMESVPVVERRSAKVVTADKEKVPQKKEPQGYQSEILLWEMVKPGNFKLVDKKTFHRYPPAKRVKMKGKLISTNLSSDGNNVYFNFGDQNQKDLIRGVVRRKYFDGKFELKTFDKFKGKVITLNGRIASRTEGRPPVIKIVSLKEISVSK